MGKLLFLPIGLNRGEASGNMAFGGQEKEVVKRRALQPEEDSADKVDRQCKRGGSRGGEENRVDRGEGKGREEGHSKQKVGRG